MKRVISRTRSVVKVNSSTGIVIKRYKDGYQSNFHKEVKWLRKLHSSGITPQLLSVDDAKLTIRMSYVGERIKPSSLPADWRKQFAAIFKRLVKFKCTYKSLVYSNLLVLSGKLFLCDLASVGPLPEDKVGYRKIVKLLERIEAGSGLVSAEKYADISAGWMGQVYQKWPSAKWGETVPYLWYLHGLRVLDVGCNAGLYSYAISRSAEAIWGIEKNAHYAEQARHTYTKIAIPGEVFCGSFLEFTKHRDVDYNGLYALSVLYYFTEEELDLLVKEVMPRCKIVMLVSRENKKKKRWNNDLFKAENLVKLLERAGKKATMLNPESNFISVLGLPK